MLWEEIILNEVRVGGSPPIKGALTQPNPTQLHLACPMTQPNISSKTLPYYQDLLDREGLPKHKYERRKTTLGKRKMQYHKFYANAILSFSSFSVAYILNFIQEGQCLTGRKSDFKS